MIPIFLLDTNILSEPTRPQPNSQVLAKLNLHQIEIATATIVWHELLFGCDKLPPSKKREVLTKYLQQVVANSVPILPYDIRAAEWHAQERSRLAKIGKTPAFADGQIAAIAYVNNLIVVTNNVSDYVNFQGVKIENWFI